MELIKCFLTENDCYKSGRTIVPKGVMVHSTGANNPNVRRYAQPTAGREEYEEALKAIGVNRNANSWNRPGVEKCVHAFIGLLADGTVGTAQTLPWDRRGWHAGSGKKGSANNTHISFEICEDDLRDPEYFAEVYREAVELTAYLCKLYGLDPLADGVVICHAEGYRRGLASGHVDVEHWFPKFGKTMDGFRADAARMAAPETPPAGPGDTGTAGGGEDPAPGAGPEGDGEGKAGPETTEGDEEEMTGEEIARKLREYLAAQPVPEWAEKELAEAKALGITDGSDPMDLTPRYQAAVMALRAVKKGGEAQ